MDWTREGNECGYRNEREGGREGGRERVGEGAKKEGEKWEEKEGGKMVGNMESLLFPCITSQYES